MTGEWEVDGHLGAAFKILGLAPAHLTRQMTQGATTGLDARIIGGKRPIEVACTMTVGPDIVGMASVKSHSVGTEGQ